MRPLLTIFVPLLLVVLGACDVLAEDLFELLILHNNDMHSRFEETSRSSGTCRDKTSKTGRSRAAGGCVGGFARTVHEVRRYRRLAEEGRGRPVVYLNAGDTYTGTAWFSVHKWRICADFLNILKPDVMSLGNHEFDNGVAGLAPFLKAATSPVVGANLDFSKEPTLPPIKKSVILEVSGRKIGVIGHLTPETQLISQTEGVIFNDVVKSIKNESERLDKEGVKIIIALGHSGFEVDKQIAKEVPLVDVVIGGHTNTFLWNGQQPDAEEPEDPYPKVVTQPSGKKVPVVQAYAYTKYLGRLNVTFNDEGDLVAFEGQPEFLDTSIHQDQDVIEVLEKYRKEVDNLKKKTVGKSRVVLDATTKNCRAVECNFGNLITDAMVHYMATLTVGPNWNDVPIAVVNGGGIRNTIDPFIVGGNVTQGELVGAIPFGSQVISLKINGSNLIKTLEAGVRSNGETSRGEFLQVSGLQVVYDMKRPAWSRVVSVKARCGSCKVPVYEPVVPGKIYSLVSFSFLTNGGDGHFVLKNDSFDKKIQDLGDVDVVAWYIGQQSPVWPEEEGRIRFVEESKEVPDEEKKASAATGNMPLIVLIVQALLSLQLSY